MIELRFVCPRTMMRLKFFVGSYCDNNTLGLIGTSGQRVKVKVLGESRGTENRGKSEIRVAAAEDSRPLYFPPSLTSRLRRFRSTQPLYQNIIS